MPDPTATTPPPAAPERAAPSTLPDRTGRHRIRPTGPGKASADWDITRMAAGGHPQLTVPALLEAFRRAHP